MTEKAEPSRPGEFPPSLAYHYAVGAISVTIGIGVVILLNIFTPLDIIQNTVGGRTDVHFGPSFLWNFLVRLVAILSCVYGIVFLGLGYLLKPIAACLALYKNGEEPDESQLRSAQKRLLNLHYLFARMTVLMWIILPALVAGGSVVAGFLDHRAAIIFAARASMVGLIVASIATLRIEIASRKVLIPFFFPNGVLSTVEHVKKRSLSHRIMLVNRLGAIVPVIVFLVTLLTTQWQVTYMSISAVAYGAEILVFTVVLIFWVFVFSWQLGMLQRRTIVEPLNDLVKRLRGVEDGEYETRVQVTSNDEIGYAGEVVNNMTEGLKERLVMKRSLDLAGQVQQNLLPRTNPVFPGLDVAGTSIYCDETGGDYYDYLEPRREGGRRLGVVIGDVSGHGIASALIMATTRGFLRQRCALPGSLSDIVADVNRQLSTDVATSGSFMTMFCLFIDAQDRTMEWLRAGHDPAILYDPATDDITELKGEGIALGVDPDYRFQKNDTLRLQSGQIILLGTDGIWEARNPWGEMFGKKRAGDIVIKHADREAADILEEIIQSHTRFRDHLAVEDDITCVILKISSLP